MTGASPATAEVSSKRQRAAHTKTRQGCANCRARHVKCGLEHLHGNSCSRCAKAGINCSGYEEPAPRQPRKPVKRFRIIFDDRISGQPAVESTPKNTPAALTPPRTPQDQCLTPSSLEQHAVDYFLSETLPLLQICSPRYSIWTREVFATYLSCPAVEGIAIAFALMQQERSARAPNPFTAAVHAGQKTMSTRESHYLKSKAALNDADVEGTKASSCVSLALTRLLMLFYLACQSRTNEVWSSLKEALQYVGSKGQLFTQGDIVNREIFLAIFHLGLTAAEQHPNPDPFHYLAALTFDAGLFQLSGLADIVVLDYKMTSLTFRVFQFAALVTLGAFAEDSPAATQQHMLLHDIKHLECELHLSETSLGQHIEKASIDRALTKSMKARLAFARIFVLSILTRYQTTYDRHIAAFREVIQLVRGCLGELGRSSNKPEHFLISCQLNVLPLLLKVAMLCRDKAIRRETLELVQKCPRQEGTCAASDILQAAQMVIEFEEASCAAYENSELGYFISEESRLHLIDLPPPSNDNEFSVCMTYRPDGDAGYIVRQRTIDRRDLSRVPA